MAGIGPVLFVLVPCVLIELWFQLANAMGFGWLRGQAVSWAAFWPDRAFLGQTEHPVQAAISFVAYAFLHAGVLHLAINMIALGVLGLGALRAAGTKAFFEIYLGAVIGGAIAYAFLRTGSAPMVGASGGLFGLAGAALVWEIRDLRHEQAPFAPLLLVIGLLILLNGVLFLFALEETAWQAHLGGFVVGALLGAGMARKSPHSV